MGSRRSPTIALSAMIENNFFPAIRPMRYLLDTFRKRLKPFTHKPE
jgi:hypothetical protein